MEQHTERDREVETHREKSGRQNDTADENGKGYPRVLELVKSV